MMLTIYWKTCVKNVFFFLAYWNPNVSECAEECLNPTKKHSDHLFRVILTALTARVQ